MKKLLLITITFLLTAGSVRAEYPLGVSLGMVKVPEPEKLAQIKAAGIDHVEVVFNYFWRNAPENECYTRAYRVKALLEEAGLKVWLRPPAVQPPARPSRYPIRRWREAERRAYGAG